MALPLIILYLNRTATKHAINHFSYRWNWFIFLVSCDLLLFHEEYVYYLHGYIRTQCNKLLEKYVMLANNWIVARRSGLQRGLILPTYFGFKNKVSIIVSDCMYLNVRIKDSWKEFSGGFLQLYFSFRSWKFQFFFHVHILDKLNYKSGFTPWWNEMKNQLWFLP